MSVLENSKVVNTTWNPNSYLQPLKSQSLDRGATFGNAALQYQNMGDSAIGGSIAAAQGAVNAAGNVNVGSSISNMNQFADQASQAAGGMGADIANVRSAASQVQKQAGVLKPYAGTLSSYGNQLWGQGQGIYDTGQGLLNQAAGIMGYDSSVGGLAGEYVGALQNIDPNKYTSMAAQDVTSSYANMFDQMMRNNSRQGIQPGSGRSQSLQQQWAQLEAAALAGAKTRAYQTGQNEQLSALGNALQLGTGMTSTGTGIQAQGAGIQSQGAGLVGQAANVESMVAQILGEAGGLNATAGQLGASQANAYTAAGQLTQGAGSLALQQASLKMQAQQSLANAQSNAAMYYAQVSEGFGSLAGSGGLANALLS